MPRPPHFNFATPCISFGLPCNVTHKAPLQVSFLLNAPYGVPSAAGQTPNALVLPHILIIAFAAVVFGNKSHGTHRQPFVLVTRAKRARLLITTITGDSTPLASARARSFKNSLARSVVFYFD